MFGLFGISKECCATIRLVKTWHTHQRYTFDLCPVIRDELTDYLHSFTQIEYKKEEEVGLLGIQSDKADFGNFVEINERERLVYKRVITSLK